MYVHDLSIDSKTNYLLFVIICSLLRTVPLATLSIPSLISDFSLNPSKMKMATLLKSLCFHPGKYQGVLGTWFPHATISHYFSNWHFSDWISGLWLAVVLLLWLSETVLDWMAPCGQLSIVMSPDVLCSLRKILFFYTAFFFCTCPSANCPYPTVFLGQKHNVFSLLETVCFVNFIVFNFQFCCFPSVFASRTWISFSLV